MAEQTRRSFLGKLLGTAALAVVGSALNGCAALETMVQKDYRRKYNTIAHDFLDIEGTDLGVEISDYKRLDDIIDEAKERINRIKLDKPFTEYNKEEAVVILKEIDGTLIDRGFEYQVTELLNRGLKNEKLDCDTRSIVALGIAETLDLPLKAVDIPGHMMIRWQFNEQEYMNWEITRGRSIPDEDYRLDFYIPYISIENGIFLRSLSREETLSAAYSNKGRALHRIKRYEEAIKNYDTSTELNSKNWLSYINKGFVLIHLGKYEESIKNCDIAIELNPNSHLAHKNKGVVLLYLGRARESEECLKKARELNVKNDVPWFEESL
ncbi:hypothetical protein GOV03_01130 [Candidatus Woesearchaeota archaeon]|nr:hypothetical protein [Candidatus Woesearchaeota archaeon]